MSEENKEHRVHTLTDGETSKSTKGGGIIVKDLKVVFGEVVNNFLIPIIKNTFVDAITNGLNIALFGDANSRKGPSLPFKLSGNNQMFTNQNASNNQVVPFAYDRVFKLSGPQAVDLRVGGFAFERVRIASRADAELALTWLNERIMQTGFARVSDLNSILGIQGEWTDVNYGWTSVKSAGIMDIYDGTGGCRLAMPRAVPIEERYFK